MGTRCERCRGGGWRTYGSTATWHGGVGGQALTKDVCDRCWGSGDEANPGEDLRRKEHREREHYQRRLREDPAFRWKERAKKFARRARNHRSNYREAQREIQRWYQETIALQIQLNNERSANEQLRAALRVGEHRS